MGGIGVGVEVGAGATVGPGVAVGIMAVGFGEAGVLVIGSGVAVAGVAAMATVVDRGSDVAGSIAPPPPQASPMPVNRVNRPPTSITTSVSLIG